MRWVAIAMILTLLAATGCNSGGNDMDDALFSPEAIQAANDLRLDPVEGSVLAAVSGQLSITGFTLLDGSGLPVLDGPAAPKATARLLDPGDDILSEVIPGVDGRFLLASERLLPSAIVEISFDVEEDIDGDGEGGDSIVSRVPVALEAGRTASLTLELSKGELEGVDSELAVAPTAGMGEFMVTNYIALDANGAHEAYYGTFFGTGAVVYDTDRDEFLEAGDDFTGQDSNNNGWADDAENEFVTGPPSITVVEGVIADVNTARQTLTVRTAAGTTTVVEVPPFAGIEVFDKDGGFVGQTSLGQHLVGRQAYIEGITLSGSQTSANWIVVFY